MPPWGSLCLKKGMEEEARTFFQKFRVLNPASPVTAEMAARLGDGGAMQEADAEPETADAGTEEGPSDIPDDFQTVTLAELYIRQGHPTQAVEVLEAILRRDPQHEKAAEKLRELRGEIRRERGCRGAGSGRRRAFPLAGQYRQVARPCGMIPKSDAQRLGRLRAAMSETGSPASAR